MPYLFDNSMLCCMADRVVQKKFGNSEYSYVPWKLHLNGERVETGLPEDAVECSPFRFGDKIGFVGQVPNNRGALITAYYELGDDLMRSEVRSRAVARTSDYLAYASSGVLTINDEEMLIEDFMVTRLSPIDGDNTRMIVTGFNRGEDRSLMYSIVERRIEGEIVCRGQSVYKCSVRGGEIAYAVRGTGDIEDRWVVNDWDWRVIPTSITTGTPQRSRGFGDTVAKITAAAGVKPCGGCKERRDRWNQRLSY